MNGTDGVASHSFCFKYLSINCSLHLDQAIGVNLRFFDSQVAAFCGDKRRPFLGEGETKIFFEFSDCRSVFAAHSVFNILAYWHGCKSSRRWGIYLPQ